MKTREDRTLKATPETNSRYESTESHLFDTDATEEKALCGADTSADYRRGLSPNPPKDTDGRREESGRGVRELQGK